MTERVLDPVGVQLTDFDAAADVVDVRHFRRLLAEHGVLVLREQRLDDAAFLALLRSFGPLLFTVGETPVDGCADLNVVSNVGRSTSPQSSFHVDTSYVREPPAYTALRAVVIPARGGETLFSNQYRAFDTLPADIKARLVGRTIRHVVSGVELGPDDERAADHAVFRRHPLSGRTALYLSTPKRCASISGLDERETAYLIGLLYAHSTRPENVYRHSWAPGDVVLWDNGCVLHRADHSDVVGDRVLHRGMVAGYG